MNKINYRFTQQTFSNAAGFSRSLLAISLHPRYISLAKKEVSFILQEHDKNFISLPPEHRYLRKSLTKIPKWYAGFYTGGTREDLSGDFNSIFNSIYKGTDTTYIRFKSIRFLVYYDRLKKYLAINSCFKMFATLHRIFK